MLDFVGTVVITASMVVAINAVVSSLRISAALRLGVAVAAGVWIGLMVALGTAGAFETGRNAVPLLGILVAGFLLAVAAAVLLFPKVREVLLLLLPMPLIVGLHATRLLGVFFLLLAADGRLAGPFPYFAGWGDIISGAVALPAAWLAARPSVSNDRMVWAWNSFGTLDFVVAVSLGVLSTPGATTQMIDAGVGSAALSQLPWALVPAVLVPFYLVLHMIVFAQLRARRRAAGLQLQVA